MKLTKTEVSGVLVLRLEEKRLLAQDAPEFKEQMLAAIDGCGGRILLDMEPVEFVDSSGLGAMVAVFKQARAKGGLELCCLHQNVRSLLKLTRMDRVFPIHSDLTTAIEGSQR